CSPVSSSSSTSLPISCMAGSTPASLTAEPPVPAPAEARRANSASFSPGREAWRRFRRHHLAVVGALVLVFMVVAVALGPLIWRVAINDIDFSAQLQGPSWNHPLGTDDLGQ